MLKLWFFGRRKIDEPLLAPGPGEGDEDWQLSKDSADAATAIHEGKQHGAWVVREKVKNGINTVTEVLLTRDS